MRARTRVFVVAAGGLLAALAAGILVRAGKTQWDLRVYMECSRILASGGDPYAAEPVVDQSRFQCLYPPLVADLYRPFDAASRSVPGLGEWLFAGLKILSMFAMLWLWRRYILRPGPDLPRALMAALLYGSPFWSDFLSGNAGSFEHLVLWGALAAFVSGHDYLFAGLVAVAAQPKLLPVAFLPLAVFAPRPHPRAALAGGALAAALFGLNELAHPGLLRAFFVHLADPLQAWHYERGPNNVSMLGLLQHALEQAWHARQPAVQMAARLHSLWSLAVAALTALSLRDIVKGHGTAEDKRRRALLLYCAAFALVAPRLKDYAFLLLLPPTAAALESDAPRGLRLAILVCALLNSTKAAAETLGLGPWALFAGYFKLYAAVLVWAALVRRGKERAAASTA